MTAEATDPSERLNEVSRLAALLVRNVLDAQIEGKPVPDDHIRCLLDAGLLLKEQGIELPPLLGQIMLAAEAPEQTTSPEEEPEADEAKTGRLAWLFQPFQSSKG